ncbi:MAG TPA: hypothetical protein VIS95_10190 [Solirubrobacterales bacterium]
MLFASACLLKFGVETRRGYFHYLDDGSYLHTHHVLSDGLPVSPAVYRYAYIGKFAAAALLLFGIAPQAMAAVLAIWFLLECAIYFKFHTCYFALLAAALAFSPDLGDAFTLSGLLGSQPLLPQYDPTSDGLAAALVVCVTASLYVFSARHKWRSPEFMSGRVIETTLRAIPAAGPQRRFADGIYSKRLVAYFAPADRSLARRRCRPFARLTVGLEAVLPLMLLFGPPLLVLVGVALHLSITMLFPITLAHFSLATVGSYVLFLDPGSVTAALRGLGLA